MNMIDAIKSVFSNYFNFQGRARRSEYWWWYLFNILLVIVFLMVMVPLADPQASADLFAGIGGLLLGLWMLATFIPTLAVSVRRLHDSGKSGWWYLISFVPLGGIVLLIFFILDTEPGENQYGPDPKNAADPSEVFA